MSLLVENMFELGACFKKQLAALTTTTNSQISSCDEGINYTKVADSTWVSPREIHPGFPPFFVGILELKRITISVMEGLVMIKFMA